MEVRKAAGFSSSPFPSITLRRNECFSRAATFFEQHSKFVVELASLPAFRPLDASCLAISACSCDREESNHAQQPPHESWPPVPQRSCNESVVHG